MTYRKGNVFNRRNKQHNQYIFHLYCSVLKHNGNMLQYPLSLQHKIVQAKKELGLYIVSFEIWNHPHNHLNSSPMLSIVTNLHLQSNDNALFKMLKKQFRHIEDTTFVKNDKFTLSMWNTRCHSIGYSAPSHLVFAILRFRITFWHFIQAFR